jgi:hypothetical protein
MKKPSETVGLTLRLKESLRGDLERSAQEHGRSLNSEVIRRLERSFELDQRLEDVFGSRELFGMARAVATAMDATGRQAGFIAGMGTERGSMETSRGWIDEPWPYEQAALAAVRVLEALRPPGEVAAPDFSRVDQVVGGPREEVVEVVKGLLASALPGIGNLVLGQVPGATHGQTEQVKSSLGRLAERLKKEQSK